ncbi:Coiled-coil domain-containing protein 73 [Acipenser ruthenus]|uniref:Coiled-coil domain-containing protein 73 n=1 Tax=Acipenser ruthenus TaxID=7906 RepID=A0A444U983_ACIRT|nr:Coiled-coil domain-containing protein 73 [Acipenser ruthenus]
MEKIVRKLCFVYNIKDYEDTVISVQRLEFKTRVVEDVVELRIRREVLNSLQHAQQLLQPQTEVVSKVEAELNALQEKYQVLERDNTLFREKIKEKEDRFLHLTEEHDESKTNWGKEFYTGNLE